MSKTIVKIAVMNMPDEIQNNNQYEPLIQKVKDYIEDLNHSQVDARQQWQYLKTMYMRLVRKPKLNSEEKEILMTIEPEIMKFAEYDVEGVARLDGVNMNRFTEDDL